MRKQTKQLPEDIRSFAQNVVDTVREPLVILDGDLWVHSANRAFYQAFGVSPAETEGHLIYELGNGQWDIPGLRTLLEEIIPQSSVFNDYELVHDFPVIGRRVMLLNARQLRSFDDSEFVVLAMEDVTERERVHDLETRFTEELQKSYDRLQTLEKLRDDLTNMIVHDLRTPLTSVITGIRTIDLVGDLNEDQREMMRLATVGGDTLLGMINDLLDVDKMESGSMELEYSELPVSALVASALGQVELLAASKGLRLITNLASDLPELRGDEEKLRRTLVNLVGNALKFTQPGGSVTIEAFTGEDGRVVVFSVTDTGEGIPTEALDRIFDKFGQVESRHGGRKMSTGLGLTFCKLVVEAHGGNIEVVSAARKGTSFCFTIPLRPLG